MRLIGIDADSKKIAIVCFESGKYKFHEMLISHEKEAQDRLYDLAIMFENQIKSIKPDVAYLEEEIYVQSFMASKRISEVIGTIKFILQDNGVVCEVVPVRSWKKEVLDKGNASKDEVKAFILKKYPQLDGEMQDVFDSCAIGLCGLLREKEKLANMDDDA